MRCYAALLLLVHSVVCEEVPKNTTVANPAQTQVIERSLTSPNVTNSSKPEFRPSPQLESHFEFNKFPVQPALPESKTFSHFGFGASPINWPDSVYTTPQSWSPRIKFPATTTTAPTVRDHPYQFYNSAPSKSDNFLNRPLNSFPTVDEWNKFMGYDKKQVIQKNQFDFSAPVQSSGQKSAPDYGAIEKPPTGGVQGNPWKKVIKFLTAFIPIGLLLSALTPTVITVQSVNGTQSRSRAADSSKGKLVSSLNYFNSIGCDDRILCELVLSASATQNAEHHVENLLNTFTEEGKAVEKAEEMRKILEAVKNQDCRPIGCKSIRDKR